MKAVFGSETSWNMATRWISLSITPTQQRNVTYCTIRHAAMLGNLENLATCGSGCTCEAAPTPSQIKCFLHPRSFHSTVVSAISALQKLNHRKRIRLVKLASKVVYLLGAGRLEGRYNHSDG